MEVSSILAIGAGVGVAVLVAFAIFALVVRSAQERRRPRLPLPITSLLLRDGRIVDYTPDAAMLFDRTILRGMSWEEIQAALHPGFPELPDSPPGEARSWTCIRDSRFTLTAEPAASRSVRLTLSGQPGGAAEMFRAASQVGEFERLSDIAQRAPDPVWEMNEAGEVTWHNDAYADLCEEIGHESPLTCPFDIDTPTSRAQRSARASVGPRGGPVHWFEIVSRPIPKGWLHFAKSIDNLVNAEMAQRNFVQTLTKTFAHLPIGLAVFDKDRQLVLFNPALLDLTHLPVDFLSGKPNLLSFFDHMRENRMMPEPKNYASWRDKLYDVVTAAREDRYCETWTLPSGLTYKITGRPHPDGAVAFLIEDISAEISLTRRFRSELELTQSVLDCFGDSVAVFSRLGVLTFSNAAYRAQWKCDPDSAFAEITIVDATRDWQRECAPSPIWPEIREFVLTLRERSAWDAELVTHDGARLLCTVEPVAAGATMVRFTTLSPGDTVPVAAIPASEDVPS